MECCRRGKLEVVAGCVALLRGRSADAELIVALGGPPAAWALTGAEPGPYYWLRVWAARGLLWNWHDSAVPSLRDALSDEQWRVREMAAKVCARHLVGDLLADVARLQSDPVTRVRTASARATARLTAANV